MSLSRITCFIFSAILFAFIATPTAHADNVVADVLIPQPDNSISVIGLAEIDLGIAQEFTYTDTTVDLLGIREELLTATYADIASVQTLTVVDTCVQVLVVTPGGACQETGLFFEDLSLGQFSLIADIGDLGINLNGQAVGIVFNSGFGGATFAFDPAPTVAPTPEPASLTLAATGLLGAAGMVRRKLRPSA